MPRFILIDPWLADAKGHNFQYALDVAGAAQRRGYEPILAVRRSLSAQAQFPAEWHLEKVFEHGDCPRHWIGPDGRNPHPCDLDGAWLPDARIRWWERLFGLPSRHDRRRRITSFARSCAQLFANVPPHREDVLFLPSLTEFDFLCAARFWRDHAWTRVYDWNLQFHFNLFVGRDPEFTGQPEMLLRFQQLFRAAVDQIPEHRIHFYATTEAIARQYDALGIAIFHPLPYPVRALCDADRDVPSAVAAQPLRVTLPGGMRREKGKKRLGPLIDAVWDEFLKPGRLQLMFQASPAQIQQRLPRRLRGTVHVPPAGSSEAQSPLLAAPHPLDADRYAEFIRGSDIGLLVYDARRYFARASGVLCEMLSAGVPVIVPAGCWLAEQIAHESYRHVEILWRHHHGAVDPIEITTAAGVLTQLPTASQALLLKFNWPADAEPGTFVELAVQLTEDRRGSTAATQREILGSRESGPVGAVIRFPSPVARLRISLHNAFDTRELMIPTVQVLPLPVSSDASYPPLGRVGLIAADEQEIPRLLRDMTTHYHHYLRTAREFAKLWQSRHSPFHTLSRLESRHQSAGASRNTHAA